MEKRAVVINLGNPDNARQYALQLRELGYKATVVQESCPPSDKSVGCMKLPLDIQHFQPSGTPGEVIHVYLGSEPSLIDRRGEEALIYIPPQPEADKGRLAQIARDITQNTGTRYRTVLVWSAYPVKLDSFTYDTGNILVQENAPNLSQDGLVMLRGMGYLLGNIHGASCLNDAIYLKENNFIGEAGLLIDTCSRETGEPRVSQIRHVVPYALLSNEMGQKEEARVILNRYRPGPELRGVLSENDAILAGAYRAIGDDKTADEIVRQYPCPDVTNIADLLRDNSHITRANECLDLATRDKANLPSDVAQAALALGRGDVGFKELAKTAEEWWIRGRWQIIFEQADPAAIVGHEDEARVAFNKTIERFFRTSSPFSRHDISGIAEPLIFFGLDDILVEFIDREVGYIQSQKENFGDLTHRYSVLGHCYGLLLKAGQSKAAARLEATVMRELDGERDSFDKDRGFESFMEALIPNIPKHLAQKYVTLAFRDAGRKCDVHTYLQNSLTYQGIDPGIKAKVRSGCLAASNFLKKTFPSFGGLDITAE